VGSAPKINRKPAEIFSGHFFHGDNQSWNQEFAYYRNLSGCLSQKSKNELPAPSMTVCRPEFFLTYTCGELYVVLGSFLEEAASAFLRNFFLAL
jgi:hypothetical protein